MVKRKRVTWTQIWETPCPACGAQEHRNCVSLTGTGRTVGFHKERRAATLTRLRMVNVTAASYLGGQPMCVDCKCDLPAVGNRCCDCYQRSQEAALQQEEEDGESRTGARTG